MNASTLYIEGFSYDGTGEEAQFYVGRGGEEEEEEGELVLPLGDQLTLLDQLENRNLYLRYGCSVVLSLNG